jgi:hypothetical protein
LNVPHETAADLSPDVHVNPAYDIITLHNLKL